MRKFIEQFHRARAAFTLMEVNLAVFIMAVGVLAMASLYPLGFRESQQSRDDVHAAITANEVLGQLTAALSSRNIEWTQWRNKLKEAVKVSDGGGAGPGWLSYFRRKGNSFQVMNRDGVNGHAGDVLRALVEVVDDAAQTKLQLHDTDKYSYGIVVQWGRRLVGGEDKDDYSRVSISFRMSRRPGALMAAPLYYTEVHFQGDMPDEGN